MKQKINFNSVKIEINNKSKALMIITLLFGLAFFITLYGTFQNNHIAYRNIAPIGAMILYVIFIFNNVKKIEIYKDKINLYKLLCICSIDNEKIKEINFYKSKTSNDIYMFLYLKNDKIKRVMIFLKPEEVDLDDLNERVLKLIRS